MNNRPLLATSLFSASFFSALLLSTSLLVATPSAHAQNFAPSPAGEGAPPPPGHRMQHDDKPSLVPGGPGGPEGHMGPGMRILPPGMWWKNPEIVTGISLSTDQQKRIDDLFLKSRVELIRAHATLQEDELMLEPILDATTFDQAKAQAQIDKIADTRAALEKTDAHMLLNIRAVLSPDQWTKLQAQRGPGKHDMHQGPGRERGPGGPYARQHGQQPTPPVPPAGEDQLQ
jgi:Spy/CpxP family protein refolding chaperone